MYCILGAVYIPPRSPSTAYLKFSESVDAVAKKFREQRISLVGNFNLLNAEWSDVDDLGPVMVASVNASALEAECIEVVSSACALHGFTQSYSIQNVHGNLLDLLLTQFPNVSTREDDGPLLPVDNYHPPLDITIDLYFSHSNNIGLVKNFTKTLIMQILIILMNFYLLLTGIGYF